MNTEQNKKTSLFKKPWVQSIILMVVIFGLMGVFVFWQVTKNVIPIDTAYLEAPIANISATLPGMLTAVYVHEGDRVLANTPIALVGTETLYAKDDGIIASAPKVMGVYYGPGQKVVSIVVDKEMRIVATVKETDGLDKIISGERVTFTVDAFPGKEYEGVVDTISPASNEAGIAFSISDARPTKEFDTYITFDVSKYPELKTGMSARVWIHTS